LHQLLLYVSIPLVLGHIYLAAISRSTRPSLSALIDGTIPLSYAREHHPKWAAQIEALRAHEEDPASSPPTDYTETTVESDGRRD
jgi:cytochrome b subunit of formate dehydrogenase